LRQFDTDGRWSDSHAVPVRFEADGLSPALYPNPVRETAFIQGLPAGRLDLRIVDATGRLVAQARKEGDGDRFEWPVNGLPAGAYHLQVIDGERTWTLRLLRD